MISPLYYFNQYSIILFKNEIIHFQHVAVAAVIDTKACFNKGELMQ